MNFWKWLRARVVIFMIGAGKMAGADSIRLSGIDPSLAVFNDEAECGIGAVVPWAGRLWVVTYAPHLPKGSSDRLYEITPDFKQIIRPESIGGTPANRMIHAESEQLFIGPYAIRANREVRVIPYTTMFGRHTGNARSLSDPSGKILYATMEEGIYEVDVETLEARELWGDEQKADSVRKANLPGYHGKGFYSGQGVYVYANNGEHGQAARVDPTVESGVLAEWDGKAEEWTAVRRNQFTEITGPGGILGNEKPETDAIWTVGWDAKSLILGVRDAMAGWSFYRLPKGSHSYDGAHGWNTEWPRIREIGEEDYLMTMHGTFWRFPKTFTAKSTGGIRPRSNYLKVIGDFCRWQDWVVLGCDDTAKAEFLNRRKAKGEIAAPQSQSNLWFLEPEKLDNLGPVLGRGAVWMREDLEAGKISDPYLFAGYHHRGLHLAHQGAGPWRVIIETGSPEGSWAKHSEHEVRGAEFVSFESETRGEWMRLRSVNEVRGACAALTYRALDQRDETADAIFSGLAKPGEKAGGGIVRARNLNKRTLSFAAISSDGKPGGYYELDESLQLKRVDDPETEAFTRSRAAIPKGSVEVDAASAIFIDDDGSRWRLPKGDGLFDQGPLGGARIAREVATERDLMNVHGTFYELPARNAGGVAKLRPVATHQRWVHDFCSYRGLLIMSGIADEASTSNPHILRSDDGQAALWAGCVDDLWKLGKPHGKGGPWWLTEAEAGKFSDPYLMTGYDQKTLQLRWDDQNEEAKIVTITAQIDIHGDGTWVDYQDFSLNRGEIVEHRFPAAFSAYWIRFVSDSDAQISATLIYEVKE